MEDSVWERWQVVFSPIVDDLDEFGRKHGLVIEQFYHSAPIWHFVFRKKEGGKALVEIGYDPTSDLFYVTGVWWINNYKDCFSSSAKTAPMRLSTPVDHERLIDALEETLQTIKNWKLTNLTERSGPFPEWHSTWPTEQEFQVAESRYPLID
jgi:hypothetical protein